MTTPVIVAAVLAAVLVGYWLGRLRPYDALGRWVAWQIRDDGRWWLATTPRQVAIVAVFLLAEPRMAWGAWRHRNDPPPEPEPIRGAMRPKANNPTITEESPS